MKKVSAPAVQGAAQAAVEATLASTVACRVQEKGGSGGGREEEVGTTAVAAAATAEGGRRVGVTMVAAVRGGWTAGGEGDVASLEGQGADGQVVPLEVLVALVAAAEGVTTVRWGS